MAKIYDLVTDTFREVTQIDIDRLIDVEAGYKTLIGKLSVIYANIGAMKTEVEDVAHHHGKWLNANK